jgi:hypothetical protein
MRILALGAALLTAALLATAARADGLPVVNVDAGLSGVGTADAQGRFVAVPVHGDTLVALVGAQGVGRHALLAGRWTIPAVAYDGSAAGLSGDGTTLVVIRPRRTFPQARTTLALVDTQSLRARPLVLRGDFSLDAVSPDGRSVYLIQYTSRRDPSRYAVRRYDVTQRRLAPAPVIDPNEKGEAMRGIPLSRATSSDGRWAYTLYDGGGGAPFVHALDTAKATARCIDLDELAISDVNQFRLRLRGRTLSVTDRGTPALLVDTRTFAVHEPTAPAAQAAPAEAQAGDGGGWWSSAGTGAALAAVLALAVLRRRPRLPRPWRSRSSSTPSP